MAKLIIAAVIAGYFYVMVVMHNYIAVVSNDLDRVWCLSTAGNKVF